MANNSKKKKKKLLKALHCKNLVTSESDNLWLSTQTLTHTRWLLCMYRTTADAAAVGHGQPLAHSGGFVHKNNFWIIIIIIIKQPDSLTL